MNGPKPHRSTKPTGEASTSARDGSAKGGQPGKPPADRRPRTPTPQPASSQSSPPVSQPAGNQPDASASKPTGDRLGPPAPKQPGDQPVPPAPKGAGNQPSPPPSEPANDQPDTAASKQVGVKDGSDVNEVQLSVRFTAHGGEEIATRFMTLSIPKNPVSTIETPTITFSGHFRMLPNLNLS